MLIQPFLFYGQECILAIKFVAKYAALKELKREPLLMELFLFEAKKIILQNIL